MDDLRKELAWLLEGGGAHVSFEEAIAKIPQKLYGAPVAGLPYTLWRVLQHMKISQTDILDYIKNPDYEEKEWPEGYWPAEKSPPTSRAWQASVEEVRSGFQEAKELVLDPKTKLLKPIPHIKNGPTILHEILLLIDHNSYHIGQIVLLRGLLGNWKD